MYIYIRPLIYYAEYTGGSEYINITICKIDVHFQ